ncbi:sodium-dependent transporter [Halococcoides cellulosivorans]|uniref:Daunorubicin ABC transporter ATP-binding protein n=1 Tax=Halococcoides cellulosivorans TaxID=1679096 RepID=A0A2R4WXN7_9EURY|nr:sodium-dependent transporter [Halococcoides cellulosivorans]AWB26305.1 daunorubicin ABC transporter ATP-binding protein [Halococcoides cellulosivorans]
MSERDAWATRLGFILAAVGSAVGLGNVWRFPWMTADNGGSAFLVVYLAIVFAVALPGLIGEFVVGRRGERNPVGTFARLGSSSWRPIGWIAVLTSLIVLTFYSVAGGWVLRYLFDSAGGDVLLQSVGLASTTAFGSPGAHFGAISVGPAALIAHLVFIGLTGAIVYFGVADGIERATKIMVPAIVLLLIGLAAWAFTLEGAAEGLAFYLAPDIDYLAANLIGVVEAAAGQALFTLSVGAGVMLTYASYLDEDRSLFVDGASIAVLNTAIGLLAGLVVFPIVFSFGSIEAGSGGPGVIFVSLAQAFSQLPAGRVIGAIFYLVLALAALSSAISIMEVLVAYLVDEHAIARERATVGITLLFAATGTVCALSSDVFALFADNLANLGLATGLLAFLLFAVWILRDEATDELRLGGGRVTDALATPWLALIATVLPVFLVFTILGGLPAALTTLGDLLGSVPGWGYLVGAIALVGLAHAVVFRTEIAAFAN